MTISVVCVQPIGRSTVERASSRIAVAPFGKTLSRDSTASKIPNWRSTRAT
jgi:hypothetical protein